MVVDNGCRRTGYAGQGRLPACSGSHTNKKVYLQRVFQVRQIRYRIVLSFGHGAGILVN